MQDFERLGVFYLGRRYDLEAGKPLEELVLYDSKDLTTHALCVGMTGSGKTGLCLALLEEAAIDGIPALVIDPKGDLGNLLLTFPGLGAGDFLPWIDPAEAQRTGQTPQALAAQTAERWQRGLAEWGQDGARIQRLRDAVEMTIYTPGSTAGLPLTVLRSFAAPPESVRNQDEAFREAIAAAGAGLLSLLGREADPLTSRELILLSNILDQTWRGGADLDLPQLIRAIQSPPFDKVGVIDLESFFPAKERFALAMQLNNLLASPGFAAWMQGEPLDIQRLLYTPEGKPRLAIVSIAHLSDAERMFFVTLLLSAVISWMRGQSGTSSLRAILYMDEVFGYFPPSANPPSKKPMLTLLKQARAFGLGVVLATQNPVDLDYKGLANCGTWFLGRLQTERDKLRVLDGLEGASTAAGAAFDRAAMERILSGLGNRVFLLNNVHEDQPVVFQTRWALSYLRGPLSREQIAALMADRKATLGPGASAGGRTAPAAGGAGAAERPVLPPEIVERFLVSPEQPPAGEATLYAPALLGQAKVHFVQAAAGVDLWQDVTLLLPVNDAAADFSWDAAEEQFEPPDWESQPAAGARYAALPGELTRPKRYSQLATSLKEHLYRNRKLRLFRSTEFKQVSQPNESEGDFRARLAQLARERRDQEVEKLRARYAPKVAALQDRLRRAEIKVEKEKSQANQQTFTAALSLGASVLGALLGRKLVSATNLNRAATSARQASKIARERQDISDATESAQVLRQRLADVDAEFTAESEKIAAAAAPDRLTLEELLIQPRKADLKVEPVILVWVPQRA